ncbi:hypothetical protein V6Z11_A01G101200 [Gossypium hirsutum]
MPKGKDGRYSFTLTKRKTDTSKRNRRELHSIDVIDDKMDARDGPNSLRICMEKKNMRVPNYTPNIFGPMHSHHDAEEQDSEEREYSDDEEVEAEEDEMDSQ